MQTKVDELIAAGERDSGRVFIFRTKRINRMDLIYQELKKKSKVDSIEQLDLE